METTRFVVLVIDDDRGFRELLRHELEDLGITFLGASTEEEAWGQLATHKVDLVAVDACLPGKKPTTVEFVRELRARFDDLPVVAVSVSCGFLYLLTEAGANYTYLKSPRRSLADFICEILGVT